MNLTQQRVKQYLSYDSTTGNFKWIDGRKIGTIAGSVRTTGYRHIMLDKKSYYAHRLAWFYINGEMPPRDLDHKNGDRDDNRIDNLRLATRSENSANRKGHNKLGLKGVGRSRRGKGYTAFITKNGYLRYLGTYITPEEAHAAYVTAATQLHGEFARA